MLGLEARVDTVGVVLDSSIPISINLSAPKTQHRREQSITRRGLAGRIQWLLSLMLGVVVSREMTAPPQASRQYVEEKKPGMGSTLKRKLKANYLENLMLYLIIKTSYQRDTYDFSCFHHYIN